MFAQLFAALLIALGRSNPQPLRIVANEYAFYTPSTARPGLNEVVLVNRGKELHHIVIMRLPDSLDASRAYQKLLRREPLAGAHGVGGPAAIMPGDSSVAWITLEPGRYMFICFIPAQDKMPHMMKGMVSQLEVTGARLATNTPTATATLTAKEYSLEFSEPLRAGPATIEFRNWGAQEHDYVLLQIPDSLDPVETARRLGRADTTLKDVKLVGGAGPLAPGQVAWSRAVLARGHYAIVCYAADAKDGRSHYLHGMVRTFDVR